jgi:hypothetical protein
MTRQSCGAWQMAFLLAGSGIHAWPQVQDHHMDRYLGVENYVGSYNIMIFDI